MDAPGMAHASLVRYAELSAKDSEVSLELTMSEQSVYRRTKAIRWINVITHLAGCESDAKDTCILIFDKYMMSFFLNKELCTENSKWVSLSAAAATLIGTKIHYSKKALSVDCFPYYDPKELVAFERQILEKIRYDVDPAKTPASLMRSMLCVWPNCIDKHENLLKEACELVSGFWLSIESTQYSPITIAISALLLAFTKLKIDSSDWLSYLPSTCHSTIDSSGRSVVDRCLESFRRPNNSPTTVSALIENKLTITPPPFKPKPTLSKRRFDEDVGGSVSSSRAMSSTMSSSNSFMSIASNGSGSKPKACMVTLKRPVPIALEDTRNFPKQHKRRRSDNKFM